MAFRLSSAARSAACNAVVGLLDAGTTPGVIAIRTGAPPDSADDGEQGILLGTLTFNDPAFADAIDGVAAAHAISSDTRADNSGTAGHFRMFDGDGNIVADGTCGQDAGDLSFDNNVVVEGGLIAITAITVSAPVN